MKTKKEYEESKLHHRVIIIMIIIINVQLCSSTHLNRSLLTFI